MQFLHWLFAPVILLFGNAVGFHAAPTPAANPDVSTTNAIAANLPVQTQSHTVVQNTVPQQSNTQTLKLSIPLKVQSGKPFTIAWQGSTPQKTSIGFLIEHDLSSAGSAEQFGRTGPLSIHTLNTNGKQSGTFTWDGHSFACAPEDSPKLCIEALTPGAYILKAIVYDEENVALVSGPIAGYTPPKVLITASIRFTAE